VSSAATPAAEVDAPAQAKPFARDFIASIVVFLVAMPLCMGIAVASGVSPEKGLITGIVGGIVVGALAGSPLQVSGPAAGLAVIIFELVRDWGLAALGPVILIAGILQILAGVFRFGGLFRAISPAVVHGMLAGIGVLIVAGQFHVLFDESPLPSGIANLAAMPGRILGLTADNGHALQPALIAGLTTIAVMLGWEKLRPQSLRLVPGALMGVVAGTLVALFLALDVARVDVPESIFAAIAPPTMADMSALLQPGLALLAVAIAFIASAETLLSAAAVDRMHDGVRTDYNKELRAQGVGNLICGAFGALPMTGVIVRSSANVQAGAMTRASAMLHGVWILGFVALLPWLLREIPMAALAGVLVVTGWRLVSLKHVRHLLDHYGIVPAMIWAVTLVMVVSTDLLTGVLVGLGLSLLELLPHIRRLRLRVRQREDEIALEGTATFVTLPKLNAVLDEVPDQGSLRLDVKRLKAVDHTSAEVLRDWVERKRRGGLRIELLGSEDTLRRLQPA
jgi:MFS superfamily sulfate permease-like transporter